MHVGLDVIFTYKSSKDKAEILKNELKSFGVNVEAVMSDASDLKSAQNLIENVQNLIKSN